MKFSRVGSSLAEILVVIGLLAITILIVAQMSISINRSSKHQRRLHSAQGVARDTLESYMLKRVDSLSLGAQPTIQGKLIDDTLYSLDVTLSPADPSIGLSDAEAKRVSVNVKWKDETGPHNCSEQSYLVKTPRP